MSFYILKKKTTEKGRDASRPHPLTVMDARDELLLWPHRVTPSGHIFGCIIQELKIKQTGVIPSILLLQRIISVQPLHRTVQMSLCSMQACSMGSVWMDAHLRSWSCSCSPRRESGPSLLAEMLNQKSKIMENLKHVRETDSRPSLDFPCCALSLAKATAPPGALAGWAVRAAQAQILPDETGVEELPLAQWNCFLRACRVLS